MVDASHTGCRSISNVDDVRERALHLGHKALAMIMANSTCRFYKE
jgi:hypothetical protein